MHQSQLQLHFCVFIWASPSTQKVSVSLNLSYKKKSIIKKNNNLQKDTTNLGGFFIFFSSGTKNFKVWYTWDQASMVAMVPCPVRDRGSSHSSLQTHRGRWNMQQMLCSSLSPLKLAKGSANISKCSPRSCLIAHFVSINKKEWP